jgi:hypothetical protein
MKVKELLKNFNGDNAVYIHSNRDYPRVHRYPEHISAVIDYGSDTINSWAVTQDIIHIFI